MQKDPCSPGTSAISAGHAGGGGAGGGGGGAGGGGAGEAHIVHSRRTTVPSVASAQYRRRAALMVQPRSVLERFYFASEGRLCMGHAQPEGARCVAPSRHATVPCQSANVCFLSRRMARNGTRWRTAGQ